MSSDPRVHKPRLPKAYTDQQLAFLKGHLPEFEARSQGSIRGDAKKFALEKAQDFIQRFGLPDEFIGVEEPDSRFKEQIYNWFKNTVGRTRRKLEGRPRSAKKAAERAALAAAATRSPTHDLSQWNSAAAAHAAHAASSSGMGSSSVVSYHTQDVNNSPTINHPSISVTTTNGPQQQGPTPAQSGGQLISPIQYTSIQQTTSSSIGTALNTPVTSHAQPPPPPPPPQQQHTPGPPQHSTLGSLALAVITEGNLRDAFSQGLDAPSIANMIQTFVASNPGPIPLVPVVEALFEAISGESGGQGPSSSNVSGSREPFSYVKLYCDASSYFPPAIMHAGVSGPMAGPRALQMQIRKNSVWIPSSHFFMSNVGVASPMHHHSHLGHPHSHMSPHSHHALTGPASRGAPGHSSMTSTLSLSDEMHRIALDRQRRKDHIQWARIHAAALELDMLVTGRVEIDPTNGMGNQQHHGHTHNPHGHTHNGHATHSVSHNHPHALAHQHHNHDMNAMSGISSMSSLSPMAGGGSGGVGSINGISPSNASSTITSVTSMSGTSGYSYAMGRAFSEMTARDAVWEADEVEWVAGICVLRAVIRTAMLGDRKQRDDYDELLRAYEGRWKEIKDEARQALVAEVLLSAKDELSRLDNSLS
ncbi:hypothetical protein CPB83DRAFT_851213 [Crepidotus variabilis]|uniref:Uncharacterized protein n=1 Tax=Crepidotus variabilis TaxID=179855 RepID=A0A9P6EJW8_9AGAR|nr:hypothetical protein CPB83DRAFT_851213 [Crepidotus variabilis]